MKFAMSLASAIALAVAAPALGQDKPAEKAAPKVEAVVPQVKTSQHSGVFGG